jgi:hypothetical protein
MESQILKFELERHKYVGNPAQLRMFETMLKKYKDQIDKGFSYKYAVQGVLLDDLSRHDQCSLCATSLYGFYGSSLLAIASRHST